MDISFIYRNISLLYRSLEEIQRNVGYVSRRGNSVSDIRRAGNVNTQERNYVINGDQRFMINSYISMYTTIIKHVEFLYNQLSFVSYQPNPLANRANNLVYYNGRYYNVYPTDNPEQTPLRTASQPHVLRPNAPTFTIPSLPTGQGVNSNSTQRTQNRSAQRNISVPNTIFTHSMRNFNEPVYINPTPEQIANATTNVVYENIETPLNDRCPISLEVFQPSNEVTQINHCRHIFNSSQLAIWFQRNVRCPVCRFDIRDQMDIDVPGLLNHMNEPNTMFSSRSTNESAGGASAETTTGTTGATTTGTTGGLTNDFNFMNQLFQNEMTNMFNHLGNEPSFQNVFNPNDTEPTNLFHSAANEILTNLFNNNIEHLSYDTSNNSIMFDTYIHPRRHT